MRIMTNSPRCVPVELSAIDRSDLHSAIILAPALIRLRGDPHPTADIIDGLALAHQHIRFAELINNIMVR